MFFFISYKVNFFQMKPSGLLLVLVFTLLPKFSDSEICCENANSPLSPSYEACSPSSNWTSPAASCLNCYASQIQCSYGVGTAGSGCTNSSLSVAPICDPSKICSTTSTTNCSNCNSASPVCTSPSSNCFGVCSTVGK